MSEETIASTAKTVRTNETSARISCTTDGFLVPFGEIDSDSPGVQQQDIAGLLRRVLCLFLIVL